MQKSYSFENNDEYEETECLDNDQVKFRDDYIEKNWDNMYHEAKFLSVL